MDYYQQYDFCFTISLCSSEGLEFRGSNLHFSANKENEYSLEFPLGCMYDSKYQTSTEMADEQKFKDKKSITRIPNIVEAIATAFMTATEEDTTFMGIAKYIEYCLRRTCSKYDIDLKKMYLVFIIPNQWSTQDIVESRMHPLLEKSGIHLPGEPRHRVSFVTKLEAHILNFQLGGPFDKKHMFLRSENRCILYEICQEGKLMKLESAYFQLKEDYSLQVLQEKLLVPRIKFVTSSQEFDAIIIKQILQSTIAQHLMTVSNISLELDIIKSPYERYSTIVDYIMEDILGNINDFRDEKTDFDFENRITFDDELLDMHLNTSQIAYLKSNKFFEDLMQSLSKQLFETFPFVRFVKSENKKVKHLRKSLLVNECFEIVNMEWFRFVIAVIFYRPTQDADMHTLIDSHKQIEKLDWHFVTDGLYDDDYVRGAFLGATRRMLTANIALPPIIVVEHKSGTKNIGLPFYSQVTKDMDSPSYFPVRTKATKTTGHHFERLNHIGVDTSLDSVEVESLKIIPFHSPITTATKTSGPRPQHIVHIDISLNSTKAKVETVDNNGFIQRQFQIPLDILETNLKNQGTSFADAVNKLKSSSVVIKMTDSGRKITKQDEGIQLFQSSFTEYLNKLLIHIDAYLAQTNIALESVAYVLCGEKYIKTPTTFNYFIDDKDIATVWPRIIVADKGEKAVWDMIQRSQLNPPSYYIHSHLTDGSIYLKLHQIVNTSEFNKSEQDSSIIFIKEKKIETQDVYDQVSETFWRYIQSLDNNERAIFIQTDDHFVNNQKNFEIFNNNFVRFLKNELLSHRIDDHYDIYTHEYVMYLTGNTTLITTLHQLLEIAIIPVLSKLMNTIVSSLIDYEEFGYFEISKLFITGSFLKTQWPVKHYGDILTTEMAKKFKQLTKERAYDIKIGLVVDSYDEKTPTIYKNSHKSFCFDVFVNGELRIVSSSSYIINMDQHKSGMMRHVDFGGSTLMLAVRGMEFRSNRTVMKVTSSYDNDKKAEDVTSSKSHSVCSKTFVFGKYAYPDTVTEDELASNSLIKLAIASYREPRNAEDFQKLHDFQKMSMMKYELADVTTLNHLATIRVEPLHYICCIKITCENYYVENNQIFDYSTSYQIGERQTLKYFQLYENDINRKH